MKKNFIPEEHGFRFVNRFSGVPLPSSISTLSPVSKILSRFQGSYGLCGGMSSAASDFFYADRNIPLITTVPEPSSPLYRYLYQRQIDSYGSFGVAIAKFAQWMALPDSTVGKQTYYELEKVITLLDKGQPVVLGIVYVSFSQTIAVWINHQVLAHSYSETTNKMIEINIYDPNFPGRNDIFIEVKIELDSIKCTQKVSGVDDRNIRGFFVMPYRLLEPPKTL